VEVTPIWRDGSPGIKEFFMSDSDGDGYIKGSARHRRTQNDYMSTLLDAVSLEDWRDVVTSTLAAAKDGDHSARMWLTQYLVGKPDSKAPTPLTVVVQQWSGEDPVARKLAEPVIDRTQYPMLYGDDEWKEEIRKEITAELEKKSSTSTPDEEHSG
jgi:hypothetical protein